MIIRFLVNGCVWESILKIEVLCFMLLVVGRGFDRVFRVRARVGIIFPNVMNMISLFPRIFKNPGNPRKFREKNNKQLFLNIFAKCS